MRFVKGEIHKIPQTGSGIGRGVGWEEEIEEGVWEMEGEDFFLVELR